MKLKYLYSLIVTTLVFSFVSCEFGLDPDNTFVTGQIVDSQTGNPIAAASIKISDGTTQVGTSTDSEGKFTAELTLEEDKDLQLIILKEGYKADTLNIFVLAGSTKEIQTILLEADGGSSTTSSGHAASIYLLSQSHESIGVKESGAVEACQIIFEVLDSSGIPITQENRVVVKFSFLSNPEGGEYLYPDSSFTNAFGRASVTLNSGTMAGVIQILATIQLANNAIQSRPVLISIHGGLPDQNHFDVASEFLNYPVYGTLGYVIPFTAYVGDKYSNPVRPNTSVYFSTSSGIIEGSALTSDIGTATANLLSQPYPDHLIYGPGFLEVIASTIDENSEMIYTSSVRLLSGFPIISVSPTLIDIQNGGSQIFTFTVSDGNNNPLAKGNSISVTVEEGNITLLGDTDYILPDTQSEAFTHFSFSAFDSEPDTLNAVNAVIKIQSTGPNGDESINIFGTSR
ncbi:MAG: carboxypeptidase regulatory-like domain-containing protein [Ignavibacteriaceae bacterium]